MAVSPLDSTRRYTRGDVDNIYRWDESTQQWYPTKISSAFPASINNSQVAYLGSPGAAGKIDGLYRTIDGGATWTQVSGGGLPITTSSVRYEFALPRFDTGSGIASNSGVTGSRIQFVTYISHAETTANDSTSETTTGGGILKSADGGVTWTDISRANARIDFATVDASGNLWTSDGSANVYKYSRSGS